MSLTAQGAQTAEKIDNVQACPAINIFAKKPLLCIPVDNIITADILMVGWGLPHR